VASSAGQCPCSSKEKHQSEQHMNRTTSKIAIQNPPNQPKIYKIIKQINDNIQTKTIPTYAFQKLVAAD
jgi:hypothetical protein